MIEQTTKAPWHLWAIGIVSLIWNAFGAFDYVMSKTVNREYLAQMPGDLEENIAYLDSFPLLMNIFWGLGVWGAVLGSILLLVRSKLAAPVFLLSAIGAIGGLVMDIAGMTPPKPEALDTPGYLVFSFVIIAISLGLWLYSRAMAKQGVLK